MKRVYYLSLEFLIGRSLANNITNLWLDQVWTQFWQRPRIVRLLNSSQVNSASAGTAAR